MINLFKNNLINASWKSVIFGVISGLLVGGLIVTATSSQNASISSSPERGLVAYYNMDEHDISGSNLRDATGNGNDGTIHGASVVTGKIGQALDFDGSSDYVEASNFTETTNTVTFWAKDAGGQWNYYADVEGTKYVNDEQQDWTNEYYQVVDDTLELGKKGAEYYQGKMDDVRIYDRALSQEEIEQAYNASPKKVVINPSLATTSVSGESIDEEDEEGDYNKTKKLDVTSTSGESTVSRTVPIKITSGDDSTTGTGTIKLDWTNISSTTDIAIYDENDNLLDYYIEKFDEANESAVIHVYKDWVRDGTTQLQVAYGDGSSDQSVSASTVFDKENNLPVAYAFNEDSGDLLDLTSNNNDGTLNGGVTQGETGIVNGAYEFDGSDDYVELPDGMFNGLLDGNNDFSVEIILSTHSFPSGTYHSDAHTFFAPGNEHNIYIQLGDDAPVDEFSFRAKFSSSGWTSPVTSGVINENQLYHLVITYDTTDGYKMYLDGDEVDSNSITEDIETRSDTNMIGGYGNTDDRFWDGKGDDFKVYATTLTPEEVQAKANAVKSSPDFFSQQVGENF